MRALPAVIGPGVVVAIAVGVVAYAAGHYGERPKTVAIQATGPSETAQASAKVPPQVAAGAHAFVQFGCAQCHGPLGRGGVDPAVPALKTVGQSLTVAQLTHIIDHGLGASADPKQPYMPGAALYVRYGCINCHGPNGLGGVPNPLSEDKTIPPLSGRDFRGKFDTDAKIAAVIRSGSVIGRGPIVSMPHWGGILSDQQIAELTAYLKTLK